MKSAELHITGQLGLHGVYGVQGLNQVQGLIQDKDLLFSLGLGQCQNPSPLGLDQRQTPSCFQHHHHTKLVDQFQKQQKFETLYTTKSNQSETKFEEKNVYNKSLKNLII